MGHTDIRNHADIRACDRRKAAHFPEMIDAHLKNRDLMSFLQPEDGNRKPPLVVKIPQCLMDGVFLGDDRSNHLLGAGLARAPGNAHDLDIEGIPVELRNVKQRLTGGFHKNIRKIRLPKVFMGNHA